MNGRIWVAMAVLLLGLPGVALHPVEAAHGPGPHLVSVATADLFDDGRPEANGKIDTLVLTFDAALDEETFHVSDFKVSGRTVIGYELMQPTLVHLWIEEVGFDTHATPALSFDASRLRGTTGQAAGGAPPTTVDGAAPVLVSVRAVTGSPDVTVRFSEPVTVAGGMDAADWVYRDDSGAGASAIASVAHTAASAAATLTLDAAVAGGDLAVDRVRPTATVEDGAGNAAHEGSLPLLRIQALEARADIGSAEVRVVFSVPVQGAGGGTVSDASGFDVVYDAPPDDPIAGVTDVAHTAGSYEVVVTLTDAVKQEDVRSLEPARMQVLGDRVEAAGTGDPVPFASIPFVDRTEPRPIGIFTQDRNRNGFLDAMVIQWSEPVQPVCVDGLSVGTDEDSYELDLQAGELPFASPDGKQLTIPIKEEVTGDPDTGVLPSLVSQECSDGRAPWRDFADPPNDARPIGTGAIDEADGANPAIVTGETHDRDGDGLLDAYVLHFSESMQTDSFDLADWSVEDRSLSGGQWEDADTLILEFDEGTDGDTGDQPGVTYAGDGLQDLAGNLLRPFEGGGFARVDKAAPRIIDAFGDEGSRVLHLVFSEPVEAVTDPQNDPAGPGRGLQERDFAYQGGGSGNLGIVDVRHAKGDRIALVDTASPLESVDFGNDRVLPLPGHVRESNDKPAGERLTVASELITYTERDVTAPGTPADLAWDVTATTATVTLTADADDAGAAASGNVTGYHLVLSNQTLPPLTADEVLNRSAWPTIDLDPSPPAGLGDTQQIIATGLCPGIQYHGALVAVDEDGNPSVPASVPTFTTLLDTTPPEGALSFLSASHRVNATGAPIETAQLTGRVAWDGASDPESCDVFYRWALNGDPDYEVQATDNATTTPGIDLDISKEVPLPADLFVHVAAANDHGLLNTTYRHALRIVPPTDCDPQNITATDLRAVHEGGFTALTWNNIEKDLPEGITLAGYQVWLRRDADAPWELRDLIEPPFSGFETLKYIDDAKVSRSADYLVTAYFTDGLCRVAIDEDSQAQRDLGDFEPSAVNVVEPDPTIPTWALVTLLALSLLLIGGVAVFYGARRSKLDESWLEEEDVEEHDPDNPFGSDPIDDLSAGEGHAEDDPFAPATAGAASAGGDAPALDISCPACTHNFQVSGHRPLQITCPNCNASGVLE